MSSLAKGAYINVIFKAAGLTLSVPLVVITARISEEARGVYSLFTLGASLYLILFSGFGTVITHKVSRLNQAPESLLCAAIATGIVIGCPAVGFVYLVSYLFEGEILGRLWMLTFCLPLMLCIPFINGVYLARGDMLRLNVNNLLPQVFVLMFIGFGWFMSGGVSLDLVLWSWVLSSTAAAFAALYIAGKQIVVPSNLYRHMREFCLNARFAMKVGAANLISLLNYKVDLLLVRCFLDLSAAGVYSIAIVIAELLWFFSNALIYSAYGRIGSLEKAESSALVIRIVHFNAVLLTALAPVLFCAAWILVPVALGDNYQRAAMPLLTLLPGVVAYGSVSCLSVFFTNHLGRPEIPAGLTATSTVVNVIASIFLIPRLGMVGAAAATSISYIVLCIFSFLLFVRNTGLSLNDLFNVDIDQLKDDLRKIPVALGF